MGFLSPGCGGSPESPPAPFEKGGRAAYSRAPRGTNTQCRHRLPDFIAVLVVGLILLIEIKGQYGDDADLKAKAAERWVATVNRAGTGLGGIWW